MEHSDTASPDTALGADPGVAYDSWFDGRWGRYAFEVEWTALAQALGPLHGAHVLDVGCGTGRVTARLEAAGAQVVGMDRDPRMLELARARVRGPLLVADAHQLPFPAEVFDLALAVAVLEFVADPWQVVAEMARVTRRGGRLVIGALNRASPWGLAHRARLGEPPWAPARFLTRRQLLALGTGVGRARLRGALFAPGVCPLLERVGHACERVGALAPVWGAFQVLVVEVGPCRTG